MSLKLVVYDPPNAEFPHLAVAAEDASELELLYVEPHATRPEAEAALERMAGDLAKGRPGGQT